MEELDIESMILETSETIDTPISVEKYDLNITALRGEIQIKVAEEEQVTEYMNIWPYYERHAVHVLDSNAVVYTLFAKGGVIKEWVLLYRVWNNECGAKDWELLFHYEALYFHIPKHIMYYHPHYQFWYFGCIGESQQHWGVYIENIISKVEDLHNTKKLAQLCSHSPQNHILMSLLNSLEKSLEKNDENGFTKSQNSTHFENIVIQGSYINFLTYYMIAMRDLCYTCDAKTTRNV